MIPSLMIPENRSDRMRAQLMISLPQVKRIGKLNKLYLGQISVFISIIELLSTQAEDDFSSLVSLISGTSREIHLSIITEAPSGFSCII